MYCKYCGKEIAKDSSFCCFCGKSLEETTVSPTVSVPKTEPTPVAENEIAPSCAPVVENEIAPSCAPVLENELIVLEKAEEKKEEKKEEKVFDIPPTEKKPSKAHKVFHKIAKICSLVGLILTIVAFVCGLVSIIGLVIANVGLSSGDAEYVTTLLGLELWYSTHSLASSIITLAAELALIGFVFALIQKIDSKQKGFSIAVFVVSLIVAVIVVIIGVFGVVAYAQDYLNQLETSWFSNIFLDLINY